MPEAVKYVVQATVGGTVYSNTAALAGDGVDRITPTIPAAKAGSLTTRTDSDTGVVTLSTGHGITSGTGDAFWSGGRRHGMTFSVSVNALSIDGGSGDALPVANTAVTVMKPTSVPFTVNGDDLTALVAASPVPGYVAPFDNAGTPAEITAFKVDKTLSTIWATGSGVTNPLAGKVTTVVKFTHGSTSPQAMTMLGVSTGS